MGLSLHFASHLHQKVSGMRRQVVPISLLAGCRMAPATCGNNSVALSRFTSIHLVGMQVRLASSGSSNFDSKYGAAKKKLSDNFTLAWESLGLSSRTFEKNKVSDPTSTSGPIEYQAPPTPPSTPSHSGPVTPNNNTTAVVSPAPAPPPTATTAAAAPAIKRGKRKDWSKGRGLVATSHFPLESVQEDPAVLRTGALSAKEQKQWTVTVEGNHPDGYAGLLFSKLKLWAALIRLDKPVGTNLLFLPCIWGASMAVTRALVFEGADPIVLCVPFLVPIHLLISFYFGAFTMRSAGCIINDMWDRELDRKVERCKDRPLASGAVTMGQASALLSAHLILGLIILLNMSPAAIQAAMLSVPIVIIYPFMKRVTHMPQLFLGLCFNVGVFVGYAAVLNRIDPFVCVPLYIGGVCWTILYDTIYAYQDKKDDLKAGVKSSAILFGDTKTPLILLQIPIGVCIIASGVMAQQSLPFYLGAAWALWYLSSIVDHVNIFDGWSCATAFKRNVRFAFGILLSMMFGNTFWAFASEHEPEKDTQSITAGSTLNKVLSLNANMNTRAYDMSEFTWVDRFLKPAFVQAQAIQRQQEKAASEGVAVDPSEQLVIPPWMRREYFGENMATIARFLLVTCTGITSEGYIKEWEQWWYGITDHYSLLSYISL